MPPKRAASGSQSATSSGVGATSGANKVPGMTARMLAKANGGGGSSSSSDSGNSASVAAAVPTTSGRTRSSSGVKPTPKKAKTAPAVAAAVPKASRAKAANGGPAKGVKRKATHQLSAVVDQGTAIKDAPSKKVFIVGKEFAQGGFGRIYTCKEEGTRTDLVLKMEPSGNGPLFTEVNVFQRILKPDMIEAFIKKQKENLGLKWLGIPHLIASGIFEYKDEKMRYLIMPKYHTCLEGIREKSGGKLDVKSTFTVAKSILRSLQYIHSVDYTHGDVKAGNILLEKDKDFSTAVLVDFGLARMAASNEDKPDKKRAHNGTCIFTSRDAHRGCQPSFRGDIEILVYNLLYWLTGTLPWLKFESDPDRVYQEKESFCKSSATNVKKLLDPIDAKASKAVQTLLEISLKCDYKVVPDYTAMLKAINN
ncbi:hypothetical protein WR25_21150 [Diploscapter pachys]|uniref:non-specific serine/threonine protein kinase n=1 Tax=Diploscapter pachys TaxID=2018661 RepID=A0A2A2L9N7_9BILA|nr:hypothetical protein WR25_21150 [Diploscapter pachys]